MSTQLERSNPPASGNKIGLKNGLKNGAYPFNFAEKAENRPKKRSIAVHLLREWCLGYLNRTRNGALPFAEGNTSRCFTAACG